MKGWPLLLLLGLLLFCPGAWAQPGLRECVERGTTAYEAERYEEAIEWFQRAVALRPDSYLAWHSLAEACDAADRLDEALAAWEAALPLTPEPWKVRLAQARLYLDQQDEERAQRLVDQVLAERPRNLQALLVRAETQEVEGALAAYARLLEADPENLTLRLARARLWTDEQDWDPARAEVEAILRLDPGNLPARSLALQIEEFSQDFPDRESLEQGYRDLLAIQPDFADAMLQLGRLLREDGLAREAGPWLDKAARLTPRRSRAGVAHRSYEREHAPQLALSGLQYRDGDSNRVDTVGVGVSFDLEPQTRMGVDWRSVRAEQPSAGLAGSAQRGEVWLATRFNREVALFTRVGGVSLDPQGSFFTGSAALTLTPSEMTTVKLAVDREQMTQTAQLIRNQIRYWSYGAELEQRLPASNYLRLAYLRYAFSDQNRRDAYGVAFAHRFALPDAVLELGVAHRFQANSQPVFVGYFNPARYQIDEVTFELRNPDDQEGWLYGAELAGGYQKIDAGAAAFVYRAGANLGYRTRDLDVRLGHRTSNAAIGSISGFRYQETYLLLNFHF